MTNETLSLLSLHLGLNGGLGIDRNGDSPGPSHFGILSIPVPFSSIAAISSVSVVGFHFVSEWTKPSCSILEAGIHCEAGNLTSN